MVGFRFLGFAYYVLLLFVSFFSVGPWICSVGFCMGFAYGFCLLNNNTQMEKKKSLGQILTSINFKYDYELYFFCLFQIIKRVF